MRSLLVALVCSLTTPVFAMPTLVEMSEPATISRRGDPVLRLLGRGTIQAVELRPHSRGGGYLGDVRIQRRGAPISGNLATYRFGRGWQSSIRDNTGAWNPTQAGFRETVGVPTRLFRQGNSIVITPFEVPLFQHSGPDGYDFTEKENLARDDFPDDGGTDDDKFVDVGSQADEVFSEVDFFGSYTALNLGIPAFRHAFSYTLARPPGAIRQFRTSAKDAAGDDIYNPALVQPGFDPLEPSNITLSYGVRMQDIPGWTFTHGTTGPVALREIPRSPEGQDNRRRLEIPVTMTDLRGALGLMSIGKAGDLCIGLYAMPSNAGPVGGDAARLMGAKFVFVRDSGGANLIYRATIDGLHLGERLETSLVILFGARTEILRAIQALEARN